MAEHRDADYAELEAEFGEVMGLLRAGLGEAPSERPSEDVWRAIAAGAGSDLSARAAGQAGPPLAEAADPSDQPTTDDGAPATAPSAEAGGSAEVVSLASRRSVGRRLAVLTAVAAAILLVGIPLALALGDDDDGGPSPLRAELASLGGFGGAGSAQLEGRTLAVDLEGLDAPAGSFYELWLLDLDGDDLQDLRSLGRVGGDGTFTVPEDVDLDRFTTVDVSIEPDDGNPDHSGDSVLRGDLGST